MSEIIFESQIFFPTKVCYGMGELVDYIKNSLPYLDVYKIVNSFVLNEVSTDIKTLLVRPIGKTNLQFLPIRHRSGICLLQSYRVRPTRG
jgi:hypothetical protein